MISLLNIHSRILVYAMIQRKVIFSLRYSLGSFIAIVMRIAKIPNCTNTEAIQR